MRYNRAFISLGSNLGDRSHMLHEALRLLEFSNIEVIRSSSVHETEPVLLESQPMFLNRVIEVKTSHSAGDLLHICKRIERDLGRSKTVRYGPREIDLDILAYEGVTKDEEFLTLPHPGIFDRKYLQNLLSEMGENPETLVALSRPCTKV